MSEKLGAALGGFIYGFLHPESELPWAAEYERNMAIIAICMIIAMIIYRVMEG